MAIVTCHTEECPNADQRLQMDLSYLDDDGNEIWVSGVTCGVCGNPITDIVPPLPVTETGEEPAP